MHPSKENISWLEYPLFKPYSQLAHGVFTRKGGVSEGPFSSLNVSMSVGDPPDRVKTNRERIAKALGFDHLVIPYATHGISVSQVTLENQYDTHQADALFTTEKNIALCVTHADCQGALIYDPMRQVIAAVHSGWRGSAQNIYSNVVQTLGRAVGSKPENLLVCISPSLGPDHAEFVHYKEELPESFWRFQKKPNYFDFWEISKMQLTGCGIPAKNIEIASICTYCATDEYFSHRREKNGGRNASVIALKG